jgi:hypothetical protein
MMPTIPGGDDISMTREAGAVDHNARRHITTADEAMGVKSNGREGPAGRLGSSWSGAQSPRKAERVRKASWVVLGVLSCWV